MSKGLKITEPGVYEDFPEDQYHADPVESGSLSSTGARSILPPGTPAKFAHERHRTTFKREWDLGSAAHAIVLGKGPEIAILDYPNYQTKAAQEARNGARAAGQVPLLMDEWVQVQAMVMSLRRHPIAGPLFAEGTGRAEESYFWTDPATGVWRRARLDWLKPSTGGRAIVADLKSTIAADLESIQKTIARYAYHQQAAFYLDAVRDLGIDADPAFVLVFVEKSPPFQVHVVQLDAHTLRLGDARNRAALDLYQDCTTTGTWPGYPTDITIASLPVWQARIDEEEYLHD